MTHENILIVDDGLKIDEFLVRMAPKAGYHVYMALDEVMAERIVTTEPIDVVVCTVKQLPILGHAIENASLQRRVDELEAMLGQSNTGEMDLQSVEREHIRRVLAHVKGNKVEAAKLLNIGLTTVYRKIEEYGL